MAESRWFSKGSAQVWNTAAQQLICNPLHAHGFSSLFSFTRGEFPVVEVANLVPPASNVLVRLETISFTELLDHCAVWQSYTCKVSTKQRDLLQH